MRWMFGEYLQRLLDEREWPASKLAEKSGLSHVYIGNLLRGESSGSAQHAKVSLQTVIQLAKALNIPEYKLMLAYKGKDPDTTLEEQHQYFDLVNSIENSVTSCGLKWEELPSKDRQKLQESVARVTRKFVQLIVEEEIGKLK